MRTSRISQETLRVFNALSPNSRLRRSERNAKNISAFTYHGAVEVKEEEADLSDSLSTIDSNFGTEIEDAVHSTTSSRKRKREPDSTAPTLFSPSTNVKSNWTSPRYRKTQRNDEDNDDSPGPSQTTTQAKARAKARIPAKKTTGEDGTVTIHPPANWEELYNIVKTMRANNPTAPVDTMGCEDLFWENAPPRDKRYHTLTALMLSSQTKDTTTAAAMNRLHTELVVQEPSIDGKLPASGLTVENIRRCDPKHLDQLIGKVGFHNNKTRYIKAAAEMLQTEYNGDIPSTVEGLMRLPGVGPKMAYLCMSAAWGIDKGIGVDVHVHRITNLWGWHKTKNPEETRAWLESWLPQDKWHEINKMLVGLGQTVCLPVGRRCGQCDLAGTGLCKSEIRATTTTTKAKQRRRVVRVEKPEPGETTATVTESNCLAVVEMKKETSGESTSIASSPLSSPNPEYY